MVEERFNRSGYIGGSDAKMLYSNYATSTFKSWWNEKVTGIRTSGFSNIHTQAGNILEGDIMKALGIPKKIWNLRFFKEGTLAGVNTDATDEKNGVVHEIKTALHSKLHDWLHAKDGVPMGYRRQCFHAMYVTGLKKAEVHVFPMSDEEKENPFLAEVTKEKIHTFYYTEEDFDFHEHDMRVKYLTFCYNEGQTPTNAGLQIFKAHEPVNV